MFMLISSIILTSCIQQISESKQETTNNKNEKIAYECGNLLKFNNENWFSSVEETYKNQFLKPQNLNGGIGGEFGSGCIVDNKFFVFIPEYFEFGCGKVFSYNLEEKTLLSPEKSHCASKFGEVTESYIEFTGGTGDGGQSRKYSGKYFYMENRVDVVEEEF